MHDHVESVQVIDEEHSGQNINKYFSKMAVQTMINIKHLLSQVKDEDKPRLMKNQNTLAHFLNIPHPMTDNQFRDFRKSQISSLKLISGLKEKGIIDREVQAQLYNLIKRQTISLRKLNEMKARSYMNNNFVKASDVQIMTKDQLKAFKEANKADKFIDTPDIKLMDEKEVEIFKSIHPDANIVNIEKTDSNIVLSLEELNMSLVQI